MNRLALRLLLSPTVTSGLRRLVSVQPSASLSHAQKRSDGDEFGAGGRFAQLDSKKTLSKPTSTRVAADTFGSLSGALEDSM